MCGAGKVEPHGLVTMHGVVAPANCDSRVAIFPAGICPFKEKPRNFAPTLFRAYSRGLTRMFVTIPLQTLTRKTSFALAASRFAHAIATKKNTALIRLTDLFTLL
ncbi:hypothetical protein NBRC116589_36840 [Ruegeria sp. HU-ET01832]